MYKLISGSGWIRTSGVSEAQALSHMKNLPSSPNTIETQLFPTSANPHHS